MKQLAFSKYSGCGNDFVLLKKEMLTPEEVRYLCHRHHGVGADGVLLCAPSSKADFRMHIYNADGSKAEMCGNGIRCLAHAIAPSSSFTIESDAGVHKAKVEDNFVSISMTAPLVYQEQLSFVIEGREYSGMYLNTGVPHFAIAVESLETIDVNKIGRILRFHPHFAPKGTNVTFYARTDKGLAIRTYERGVEAETQACGTGACAAAYAAGIFPVEVEMPSKECLRIEMQEKTLWMCGSVQHVFDGTIRLYTDHN